MLALFFCYYFDFMNFISWWKNRNIFFSKNTVFVPFSFFSHKHTWIVLIVPFLSYSLLQSTCARVSIVERRRFDRDVPHFDCCCCDFMQIMRIFVRDQIANCALAIVDTCLASVSSSFLWFFSYLIFVSKFFNVIVFSPFVSFYFVRWASAEFVRNKWWKKTSIATML